MSKLGKVIFAAMGLIVLASSARADEAKQPQPLSRKQMKEVRGADDGYISYDALLRDSIPDSRRQDNNNDRPGGGEDANPWSRGCNSNDGCRN